MIKLTIYADDPEDRYFALRTAEHLIKQPEKRDIIITFDTRPPSDYIAYRTKVGTIIARKASYG